MGIPLVQPEVVKKWEKAFAEGSDKRYPSIDLVRLEYWFFKHPGEGMLLEYGFGTGVNTIHLLECGYTVVGIDAALGAKRVVERKLQNYPELRERVSLYHLPAEAERLDFRDGIFDYLVCVSVLSLLGSKERVRHLLSEFVRVLKPGGKAILDINDTGKDEPVRCLCLPDEQSFVKLVEPYFHVVDIGYSGHRYFNRRIKEFILCAEKL